MRRVTRVFSTITSTAVPIPLLPRTGQRHLTTSTALDHPSQSPPRNLDIFVPRDAVPPTQSSRILTKRTPTLSASAPKLITAHHDLESYINAHNARLRAAPDIPSRLKLNNSFVHLGTRYEYLIQSHLQSQLGFSLTRIGGKGDGGVDLIGNWTLPVLPSASKAKVPSPTFRVLVQAKRMAATRKPMPALMRELEGTINSSSSSRWISSAFVTHSLRKRRELQNTFAESDSSSSSEDGLELNTESDTGSDKSDLTSNSDSDFGSESEETSQLDSLDSSLLEIESATPADDLSHLPTLGILVTTRPLTGGIIKAMASSRRCLMYIHLEEVEEVDLKKEPTESDGEVTEKGMLDLGIPSTKIRRIAWNVAAVKSGLEEYNVVPRYIDVAGTNRPEVEAVLVFQGQPVRPP